MNNLILFATYWNEIEWIHASLAQIDRIDPMEIIICDGCFDPKRPNGSTDGTRDIVARFVARRSHARMIPAVRLSRAGHYREWFRPLPHETSGPITLAKLRAARTFHRMHLYRLNQMATFNLMIRLSERFRPGAWFMTSDADQFYGDETLRAFCQVNEEGPFSVLTSKEYTFFERFDRFTDSYESRDYNNMPHRVFDDTRFIPTRHPARVVGGRYRIYSEFETKRYAGPSYHYHLRSQERMTSGYALGDRRPPAESRIRTRPFSGEHPAIIREHFFS
ncbi:MAG TPA: hypothetical protein VFG08_08275 [Candidatus Polarisedimenticolia bacterium]|nr:hypothetical protein [Candidatus Polarisedimenticolia bacterium]